MNLCATGIPVQARIATDQANRWRLETRRDHGLHNPAALSKTAQGIDIARNFREIPGELVFSGNCSLAAMCFRFA